MSGGITEEAIREFKLEGEGSNWETEVVRGASFTSGFDFNEIMFVGWFTFMKEIVSIDMILYCMHCSTLNSEVIWVHEYYESP